MQNEISKPQKLLDEHGGLRACGWARDLLLQYDRDDITAPKKRIKEWESYLILNDACALQLSIADHGYAGLVCASLVDFRKSFQHTKVVKKVLPLGRMGMPCSSKYGDATYTEKRVGMNFSKAAAKRYLKCELLNFIDGKNLYANMELEESEQNTLVCALPFAEDKHCFHYSQKTIYPQISGIARCGGEEYVFLPSNTFGLLDWGRSVWPHTTTWNCACCSGSTQDGPVSFYLSDGPADSGTTSESACFYRGQLSKLEQVSFSHPTGKGPWTITAAGKRLSIQFEPAIPYHRELSVGLGAHRSDLIFGLFSGKITIDGGITLRVDHLAGFVEYTQNKKW